jgi:RNA polymerase sigma factor (sigma-70 family)
MSAPQPSLHTQHLAHLVEQMRQGDTSATEELIRRTGLRLEHLARRMLRRFPAVRAQLETVDVVEASRLRLLRALGEVTPTSMQHFTALTCQHIRFHLLDLARRFRHRTHQPLDRIPEPVAPGSSEEEMDELGLWEAFHEAVNQLPDEQREVVGLRFYQDMSWPEIAELLGVNERTASRRWERAFLTLRVALGGRVLPPE